MSNNIAKKDKSAQEVKRTRYRVVVCPMCNYRINLRQARKELRSFMQNGVAVRSVHKTIESTIFLACKRLGLTPEVEKLAQSYVSRSNISGRAPRSIAGACVYIAATLHGERRTQADVSNAVGVSSFAIRRNYVRIVEEGGIDVGL